jgi:V/A-type H+-transporting ATPase subunit D
MALRLTKAELRVQQQRLTQLEKYLPTLQLKKAMLQLEVNSARQSARQLDEAFSQQREKMEPVAALLTERGGVNPEHVARIVKVYKRWDNIAGVDIPIFEKVEFEPYEPPLLVVPAWGDAVIIGLRKLVEFKAQLKVAQEAYDALVKELRTVSLRVNLFEKVLIPRTKVNIRKIQVFLGDQQLAAVAQAKAAKNKILRHRAEFTNEPVNEELQKLA